MKKDLIKNNWYERLINDLRKLEFTGIVLTKHAIGKRILEEEKRPEYGEGTIKNIARDLGIGKTEIYACVQFAKKYPEIPTAWENSSWRTIRNERLYLPRPKPETPELPEGRYRVILADPPWEYDVDLSRGATRSPERNYPVMNLEEIKKFGERIKEISHTNCILFLWITAPKLNWMNDVLEAWGFEYKTNFIWDKIKPNLGHYSSVRHEILIIAGKGKCSPTCDGKTIQSIDSVQSIEKSTKHSQKPNEFRKIIETLYPNSKKIELFAREKADGWDSWGLEI